MKELLKNLVRRLGYDVRQLSPPPDPGPTPVAAPGTAGRPVGQLQLFLEDLRARGFVPRAVLDGGAHRGEWSRTLKAVFPEADCFLVEPQAEMEPYLEGLCRQFPGSRYFLAALGPGPGEAVLTVPKADDMAASLLPESSDEWKPYADQRRTRVVSIDSLIEQGQMPIPDLVKLDLQGYELEALRGGTRLFGQTEAFILEVSLFEFFQGTPLFHEVVGFMAERGYCVYDFPDLFWRRESDGALGQVDVCFARGEGILRRAESE